MYVQGIHHLPSFREHLFQHSTPTSHIILSAELGAAYRVRAHPCSKRFLSRIPLSALHQTTMEPPEPPDLHARPQDNSQARAASHSSQGSRPSLMQRKFMGADVAQGQSKADCNRPSAAIQEGIEEEHERKELYFFYGSLMDPTQLQRVLGLNYRPSSLEAARIVGYHIRMWGPYPALMDGPPGNAVKGMAYEVEGEEAKNKLADYETDNYREHRCTIRLEGGAQVSGTTFEWAGDVDDLKHGSFDLKDWQMMHLLDE